MDEALIPSAVAGTSRHGEKAAGDGSTDTIGPDAVDEKACRAFESAWLLGRPEPLEHYLPADDSTDFLGTLEELVHIELELAWKAYGKGIAAGDTTPARPEIVEGYLTRYPPLNRPEVVLRLLRQEYQVRGTHGDRPAADDYRRRFPELVTSREVERLMRERPIEPVRTEPADSGCESLGALLGPSVREGDLGKLGPYRVLRVLGRGGMGIVFEAEDEKLQRRVALKVMRPDPHRKPATWRRFLLEAVAAAKLEHEHIVTIHHVGEDRGVPYIAMPLLRGESLQQCLARLGALPPSDVLRVGRQAAEGLAAAHAAGLIHRDIKPANIFLSASRGTAKDDRGAIAIAPSSCRVVLLDFGLVRDDEDGGLITDEGVMLGTPAYVSPEQARGEVIDARSDLFSLGCVLYQAATGTRPFKGRDTFSILYALANEVPSPPRAINPAVPPALSDLIIQLLAKDPAKRFPSAEAVIAAIDAATNGTAAAAPNRKPRRRWPVLVAAVLCAAVAATAWLAGPSALLYVTDCGELTIDAAADVELVIRRGDDVLFEGAPPPRLLLPSGEIEIEVIQASSGANLFTRTLDVARGDHVAIDVGAELARVPARPPAGSVERVVVAAPVEPGKPFSVTADVHRPVRGQTVIIDLTPGLELVGEPRQSAPVPRPDRRALDTPVRVRWQVRAAAFGNYALRVMASTGSAVTQQVAVTPHPRPNGPLVFKDDFDLPQPLPRPLFGEPLMRFDRERGLGRITTRSPGVLPAMYEKQRCRDFIAEFECRFVEHSPGTGAGLLFRGSGADGSVSVNAYYCGLIDPARNEFRMDCFRLLPDQDPALNWPYRKVAPLPPGVYKKDTMNRVRFEVVANVFRVFVNDTFIADFRDASVDDAGRFGLVVHPAEAKESRVDFRGLCVYRVAAP